MTEHSDIDHVSGRSTTGHEWDGIKELNTPLPRWWVITFYLTIVWAAGYWIVYPAWPLLWSHTTGIWNYSTRAEVVTELANLEKIRGTKMAALGSAPLAEIARDPALLALARASGKTVFGDNCADHADDPVRCPFRASKDSRERHARLRQGRCPQERRDRHRRQLCPVAVGPADEPRL